MLSNRFAFAALALACIGAAAGGGYLATRQNTVPAPVSAEAPRPSAAPAVVPPLAAAPVTPAPTARPVQESEGVVSAASKPVASKPAAAKPADVTTRRAALESRPVAAASVRPDPPAAVASNTVAAQPPAPAPIETAPVMPRAEERAAQELARPAEPPAHPFEELLVSADSVIGLQTENRVSSENARVEDRIEARVTRDVRVSGRVAIPAGARALGSVVLVERGGKVKERARLGVRFHTLVLADGTRIPIATDTIYRDGEAPGNSSASKIGGAAVGGAILGAIMGGAKGMMIGAAAGAGAGGAAVAAGDRNAATLAAGSPLTVRILQPITVTTDSK